MVKGNQTAAALKLIEEVRNNELAEMIELFGNIESVLRDSHRELSIIINRVDSQFSIKADRVDKIVSIDDSQVQKNTDKSSRFVKEIANLGEQTVLILDLNELEL
jgi:chemotaxis signal transduction protein